MFEGAVAGILNRILGKYVQDLDTENLNVGIFSGNVNLTDLKLKPEALYELDLPIDVKIGTIGRINLQIPWASLFAQPVVVHIDDVLILVGPAISNTHFDPEREKRLTRAAKRKILQDLESEAEILKGPSNLFEKLFTATVNNIQVYIRNIHLRYEDSISSKDGPLACGFCLQSLSIETTNSKWKPSITPVGATNVYQLVRVECLSVYWDPQGSVLDDSEVAHITPIQYYNWKHYMLTTREQAAANTDNLDYLLSPLSCKVKVIISAGRVLLDVVTQEASLRLTRQQLLSAPSLPHGAHRIKLNRKYRHLHPGVPLFNDIRKWWKYAYNAVLEQRVRPYTWRAIKKHRANYNQYKQTYKSHLRSPYDTELKLDLQQCEDSLPIVSVVIAREHAKFEMLSQEPDRIQVVETDYDWWEQSPSETQEFGRRELCVKTERSKSFWSHLSSPEKKRVCELIGYTDGESTQEKSKSLIQHKINVTLPMCQVYLVNRNREILTVTMTQLLASLETRPSSQSYKFSARTESLLVEGASSETSMVAILSGCRQGSFTGGNHWLSVDLATGGSDADYSLACTVHQHNILYNQHAMTELINFFQTQSMTSEEVLEELDVALDKAKVVSKSVLQYAINRKKLFNINIDIKGPRIIIPEYGCETKGGKLLIISVVSSVVRSELQARSPALEDATCSEREELLYDRLHADCTLQVLFCSTTSGWQEKLKQQDSELHLVPRIRAQLVFSNTIKKDYKLLPRYKLNITVSSLKLNLSDRMITSLLDFWDTLPLPSATSMSVCVSEEWEEPERWREDYVSPDPGYNDLVVLRNQIVKAYFSKNRSSSTAFDKEQARLGLQTADTIFLSTEQSDEEMEVYARSVDLPGFDDNVSPNNNINTLLRFHVGEIVMNLSRSTEQKERPYMTVAVSKVCLDIALMEYGPAVQLSVNQATLQDHSSTTETLQLVSTDEQLFNLLYRKVRADCPDFKSHFHSVEQSLVCDLAPVSLLLHADALLTLLKYLQYICHKIQSRNKMNLQSMLVRQCREFWDWFMRSEADPPVPSGATKFSYSIRASSITLRLCNLDGQLAECRVQGLDSDCVFRANDAFIFKLFLMSLHLDQLSMPTLYPKLVWPDEDKVLELKYVVSAPRYSRKELKPHGELRVHLAKLHVVLFIQVINQLQLFLEPLLPKNFIHDAASSARIGLQQRLEGIRTWSKRINLFIEIHAPVLLLPSKPSSPDLLVLNMGDLFIENFFKRAKPAAEATSPIKSPIIDNILVKLQNITLSRAVMTLAGTLEVQEPILEPWVVRCDVKRCVSHGGCARAGLLLDASVYADRATLALGQRDLAAAVALYAHNLSEPLHNGYTSTSTPVEPQASDLTVRKLQAFFQQGEPVKKESVFRLTLEGIELKLFSDMDEILSSPVRDSNRGLARLDVNELSVQLDRYSDGTTKINVSLHSLFLTDISTQSSSLVKNIFQCVGGSCSVSGISVRRAPLLEAALVLRRGLAGDVRVDRTRLNLAAPFFILLARTLLQAMPGEKTMEGGVVNHGYVSEPPPAPRGVRFPSSRDSTSGCYSTATNAPEDTPSISLSIQFRQPEVMFFSDLTKTDGHALLLRTELLIDYSSHSNTENLVISLAGLQVMSKLQSKLKNLPPQIILKPCDVEFVRSFKSMEEGIRVNVSMSEVEIHLAATTYHTVSDIIEEITAELTIPEDKETFNFVNYTPRETKDEELWSPQKLAPHLKPGAEEPSWSSHQYPCVKPSETFTMNVQNIKILLEAEHIVRVPLFLIEMSLECILYDWSMHIHGSAALTLGASCFDDQLQVWQPIIEQDCSRTIRATVFPGKAYQISGRMATNRSVDITKTSRTKSKRLRHFLSDTDDDDNEMTLIKNPHGKEKMDVNYGVPWLSTMEEYEGDIRTTDKLAETIARLFIDETSSEESGKENDSSAPESEREEGSQSEREDGATSEHEHLPEPKPVKEPYGEDSADSGLETEAFYWRPCTYVHVWAGSVALAVGPAAVRGAASLLQACRRGPPPQLPPSDHPITLVNDIGPSSTVRLVSDAEGQEKVLATADYDVDASRPSTPGCDTSAADMLDDNEPAKKPDVAEQTDDLDCFEGGFGTAPAPPAPLPAPLPSLPPHRMYSKYTDETLQIQMKDAQPLTLLAPRRTVSKLHPLYPSPGGSRYYVVVERTSHLNTSKIVVRSPLQIRNETSYALEVYYKRSSLEAAGAELLGSLANPFDEKMRAAVVAPQDTYNVPLHLAYHCKLSLLPANAEIQVSASPGIWWAELSKLAGRAQELQCPPREGAGSPGAGGAGGAGQGFNMRVLIVEGVQSHKVTRAIPNYLIRVLPPLGIYNRLPYVCDVYCTSDARAVPDSPDSPDVAWSARVEPGDTCHTHSLSLAQTHVILLNVNYKGRPWTGTFNLTPDLTETCVKMCADKDTDGGSTQLMISVRVDRKLYCQLYLYAPYWVINNTGLPIQIKGTRNIERIHTLCSEPLLWAGPVRTRGTYGLRVRAHMSSWSRVAPLRPVPGLVVCSHHERRISYRILMQVTLSELCPQLTKIVTFLPYFLVYNDTKRHLRFMEENEAADLWIDLAPHQCAPFWPQTNSMAMHVKYQDSTVVSQHFQITKNHFTVLRMDKGSAICVDVTGGTERPFTVTFRPYSAGDAPIRIDNYCDDLFLKLHQVDSGQVALLSPHQSLLYTWDDPNKPRELIWNVYNNKEKGFMAMYTQDGFGEEKVCFQSMKHSTLAPTNRVTSKLSSTLKRLTPKSPEPCSSSSDDSDSTEHHTKPKKIRKDKVSVYWVSFMDGYQRVFALAQDERVAYQTRVLMHPERSNYEYSLFVQALSVSVCVQTSSGIKELAYCSITDSIPRWEVDVNHRLKSLSPDLTAWVEERFQQDQKKCQLKEYFHIDLQKMQMTKPFFSELRRTYNPGIWAHVRKSDAFTYFHMTLNRFQVDNQLNEAVFPCVLYPAPLPANVKPRQVRPALEIITLKKHRPSLNQEVYKFIKVLLQAYSVNLDRGFVNYIFDILNHWKVEDKPAVRLRADLALVHMPLPIIAIKGQTVVQRAVFFEYVHLSPIKLVVSLSSRGYNGENPNSPSRSRFGKKENRPKLFNSDLLEYLFNEWGNSVCDTKDVVIRLCYMEVESSAVSARALLQAAARHFGLQLLQQFHVLVLGHRILGNVYSPTTSFMRELTTYYDPFTGYMSWCGCEAIQARLCGARRRAAASRASWAVEAEYVHEDPAPLLELNLNNPATITLALSGLVSTQSRELFRGAVEGSSGGCSGLIGQLSALRAAVERSAGKLAARRRLPRHCSSTEGISTYSWHAAAGTQLLATTGRGRRALDEYVAHTHVADNYVLLASTREVMMVRLGGSWGGWHVEWSVFMDDLIGVPTTHQGKLILHIRQDELVNYFSTDEKVVEIPDPEVLQWMQAKIECALIRGLEDKRCPPPE